MQNYLQVKQPCSLVAGPRDPRSAVRLLGSGCWFLSRLGTRSGLGYPKACVGLLVVRAEVQLIPGHGLACCGQPGFTGCLTVVFSPLVFAPSWVRLTQNPEKAPWRTRSLVGEIGSWGPPVGKANHGHRLLWAQKNFMQPIACLLVGGARWPHPARGMS